MHIEEKYVGQYIADCRMAQEIIHDQMVELDHEEVWVVFLTTNNKVLSAELISKGTLTHTAVDCRTVLRAALLHNAGAIIIAHNHPSGVPKPGLADVTFTGKLKSACSLMDIKLLDHIIIGKDSFFSFSQDQTLKY